MMETEFNPQGQESPKTGFENTNVGQGRKKLAPIGLADHLGVKELIMKFDFTEEQIDRAVGSVGIPENSPDFDRVLRIRLHEMIVLEDVKESIPSENKKKAVGE